MDRYIDGFDIKVDLRSLALRQSFCPRHRARFFSMHFAGDSSSDSPTA
jgi:hypothetical protein